LFGSPDALWLAILQDIHHIRYRRRGIYGYGYALVLPNREKGVDPAFAVLGEDQRLIALMLRGIFRKEVDVIQQLSVRDVTLANHDGCILKFLYHAYINI
jgi:hypothetical protein